jgi:hypothetical protein
MKEYKKTKRTQFGQARGLAPTPNSEQRTKNFFVKTNPNSEIWYLESGIYFIKTNPISPFFNQKSTLVNRQCAKRTHFGWLLAAGSWKLFSQNEPKFGTNWLSAPACASAGTARG